MSESKTTPEAAFTAAIGEIYLGANVETGTARRTTHRCLRLTPLSHREAPSCRDEHRKGSPRFGAARSER
jgi:hypothetical protein